MATNGQNQRTQLLSDAPADEDAFEGGHDRVAEALAGLIQEEDGGKAVALKGPFGSGKSTVVQLLENELEEVDEQEGEDTRIFTYDAWEHQGDPLRRSFIESLVEFLRDPKHDWAGEFAWQDEIDRIARRKEVTTVDTKPVLTGWGRAIAITAFIAPLGAFIVNNFIRSDRGGIQLESPEFWFWVGGAVIFLLPIILVFIAWKKSDEDDSFYVFVQESRQEEETKTIKTPDPTSIEFQQTFQKILCQTLRRSNRQLIIVVDNLDRLPPEQALSTWATMRTFFETEGENEEAWMDRFWLIAPLNFEALRGVFDDSAGNEDNKSDSDVQDDGSEKQRENEHSDTDSVEDFANKTFSTVLRVAPPVLSDWEQFMKDQLSNAFELDKSEEEVAEDFHAVYRLYRIVGVEDNSIPTPRDIKIFINRLSGLYRQWGGEIDLPMLAAYQLKGDKISQDGQELTDSTFLTPRIRAELRNEDWQNQFAALHFNVQPDKATQVLIEDQVQTALETGNEEETLDEYADIAGFTSVVGRVIPRIARGDDPTPISLAALALDTVSLGAEDVENDAWRKLRRGIRSAKDWYPDEDRKGQGLLKIIRQAPEPQQDGLAKDILSTVSSVDLAPSAQDFPNDATRWTDGVLPLVRAFKDREELLRSVFHVPSGWPTYISVISHLEWEDDAEDIASFFVPADEPGGIDTAVAEMVSNDSLQAAHLRGIELAKYIEPISDVDWTETSDAITSRLSWNNNLSDDELRIHLKTALWIAAVYEFKYLQSELSDDQGRADLSHHLENKRNVDPEITALCVLLRVLYSAGMDRGSNSGDANQGHNHFNNVLQNPDTHGSTVEETANLVQEFGISWDLLNAADRWEKSMNFVQRVVRELVKTSEATTLLGHNEIAGFHDIVGKALQENEETFKELTLSANQDGNLSEDLRTLDQEDWLEKLQNESRLLDVVLILTEEEDLQLSSAFQNALHDHAEWILTKQTSPSRLVGDEWNRLLNALSEPSRNSFLYSLQKTLLSETGEFLSSVLSMYGNAIADSEATAEVAVPNPTETVNEHFRPLLQRANVEELTWLADVLDGQPDLADDVDPDIWEAFQERIKEKYQESSEGLNELLSEIAGLAGIDSKDLEEEMSETEQADQAEE